MTDEQQRSAFESRSSGDLWAFLAYTATALLAVLFVAALLQPPVVHSHGLPHADFATMLQGGDGLSRHGGKLLLSWALGAAQILLFGLMIALGSHRPSGMRGLGFPLAAGMVFFLGIWSLLMVTYAGYLREPRTDLIFSLPKPTAVMLYALWPAPLVFVLIFVLGFRRFVISEQDEATFHELVAARRRREAAEEAEEPVEAAD